MEKAGLYIHIPFCISKCSYCDFYSVDDQNDLIPHFVEALVLEIQGQASEQKNFSFDTLFFGGGTPSLLSAIDYDLILQVLKDNFDLSELKEISMEVNPGEAPESKLGELLDLGINRISIGAQSFNERSLEFLTRIHSAKAIIDTLKSARNVGFNNINCDLIYGIPGQTIEEAKTDINNILFLNPDHISAYTLSIEEGTPLHNELMQGQFIPLPDSLSAEMYKTTQNLLQNSGYEQYEISNYAKNGFECQHNNHYWNIDPYLGFGPSAHGFNGRIRWENINNINSYIDLAKNGQTTVIRKQQLTKTQINNEIVGFGIRKVSGFSIKKLSQSYQQQLMQKYKKLKSKWDGMLILENDMLKLSQNGLLYADGIAIDLLQTDN
jgi:oxygen-independent coproporphyrinogen-3 oxidase